MMFDLIFFAVLMAAGYGVGRVVEKRHYASIRLRERRLQDVLVFPMRFPPDSVTPHDAFLVHGTVVISADFFKTFVAGLRNLVGGRFRSYETLMERARREAVLRVKEDAKRKGARLVVCLRFETTTITGGGAPSMEVMAYGTALVPRPKPNPAASAQAARA
jgi:uncharacterized protein YbjQ (UPF0145 family)